MKRIILITAGLALTLLAGCVVTSVYPFYSRKTSSSNPPCLAPGRRPGSLTNTGRLHATKRMATRYLRVQRHDQRVPGHAFKLHGEQFLDLSTAQWKEDIQPEPVPSHLLVRIGQITPSLKMANLNYDWLRELVDRYPKAIRHIVIRTGDGPEDRRVVLTADTAELQRFVIKHLKTKGAWDKSLELQKATTEPPSH